jgi:RNA polymerase sigma-70 factor, ECF subfamily
VINLEGCSHWERNVAQTLAFVPPVPNDRASCAGTSPQRRVPESTVLPASTSVVDVPPIARRAKSGEDRVAGAVEKYLGLVWRVLRRSGLRPADADDAAQDVFWVLAQRLDDVPPAAERSFLLGTAIRVASDRRRSAWNRRVTEPLDPESRDEREPAPDVALEQQQLRELLDSAMNQLDDDERTVFVLMELEHLTREQAAEVLAIPAGTVASRLRRAREEFARIVRRLHEPTWRQP